MSDADNEANRPSVQDDPLGAAVHFEGHVPLAWHPPPAGHEEGTVLQANADVLRIITALDEHAVASHIDEGERGQELMRLEAKLDLILDLLGQVLQRDTVMPACTAVRLSASGIEWAGTALPKVGEQVDIEVFLDERYPRPLRLSAEVTGVARGQCHARLAIDDGEVRDALEKFIFRHHRRSIAQRRR